MCALRMQSAVELDPDIFCNQIGTLKVKSGSVPSDKNVTQNTRPSLYTYVKVAMRLLWPTLQLTALCMIQFAKAVFSENDLCMPEFSILVKRLHNNLDTIQTMWFCLVFCFAACLPATVLFVWLAEGQVSGIMWSSETVPKDAHTKFVPALKIFSSFNYLL